MKKPKAPIPMTPKPPETPADGLETLKKLIEAGAKANPNHWTQDRHHPSLSFFSENIVSNNAGDGQIHASAHEGRYYDELNYDFIEAAGNARPAIAAVAAELEALRAVVKGLPRDRNGKPLQPGDMIRCDRYKVPIYVIGFETLGRSWLVRSLEDQPSKVATYLDDDVIEFLAEEVELITPTEGGNRDA